MADIEQPPWVVVICLNCETKFWVSQPRLYCTTCTARLTPITHDEIIDITEALKGEVHI